MFYLIVGSGVILTIALFIRCLIDKAWIGVLYLGFIILLSITKAYAQEPRCLVIAKTTHRARIVLDKIKIDANNPVTVKQCKAVKQRPSGLRYY